MIFSFFKEVEGLGMKGDYPPGFYRPNSTHMDIFMALFMICAIEVVIMKILMFDEGQQTRRSARTFIEGD